MDMSLYMSKSIECATPKVHLIINHGLWVIMFINVASLIVTNAPLWPGMSIVGEVCRSGGWGYIGTFYTFKFSMNLKPCLWELFFKSIFFFKRERQRKNGLCIS